MRLAFCLDGYATQVGVAVTQPDPGTLRYEVVGDADPEPAVAHAARVLSVDVDGTGYDELVDADPVLATAYQARPGMRPPLFYSVYEALLWAVLSARRPAQLMARLRERLATEHGQVFDVAGQRLAAMPTPSQLLAVHFFPGLPDIKLARMHAIAEAARDGALDTPTLRAADPAAVAAELRRFAGIGPFYAELVTVRTLGQTDVLPTTEPKVVAATGALLGRDGFSQLDFERAAESWRPWRTWAAVALRASAAPR